MLASKQVSQGHYAQTHKKDGDIMASDKNVVNLTFLDAYARTKRKEVELATLDEAQAVIDTNAVVNAYNLATIGQIQKYILSMEYLLPGAPAAGSNIDTGITLKMQLDGRPDKATLKIPTPDPAYLLPDGTVDVTNVLITGVTDLYLPAGVARLSDGEAASGVISGALDK
jgi:hypothetical protein